MTEASVGEFGRQFKLPAEALHDLTSSMPSISAVPALQMASLTGEMAHLVGYLLRNTDEGQIDSARHNLLIVHDVVERLAAATQAAMADCDARLPVLHGRCLAKVQLDEAEREWLMPRPYAGNVVPAVLRCELNAEHPHAHAANGQMGNDIQWWVRWTPLASEIAAYRGCEAEQASPNPIDPTDREPCLLYAGHPGRHSFAIGAGSPASQD
jgi:hypothetical protein